jgi:predicted AlkP superfamily phosphohydrolase/phosphomutase
MLWRHCDLKREGLVALAAAEPQALAACPLVAFYTNVDRLLGKVRARLPREAVLIVMSDHGFDGFRRLVHLNAWLRDQGYLVLKDGQRTGQIVADAVDWQKTRLYNIGFNGLYLNLQGREAMGTVAPGASAQALLAEVTAKLEAWRDPKDGQAPVLRVYSAQAIYRGERTAEAPDLIVGFNRGFGNSDESTLGEITAEVLADNPSPWSGNHLMAPEVVPGVLLVNRPVKPGEYNLTDVTATILQSFGVAADAALDGRSFLAE